MKEIVKYSNFVNALKFKEFTAVDYDFLMMLCAKMKRQGTNIMTIDFSEIRKLTGYKRTGKEEFIENLKSMNRKLMSVTTDIKIEKKHLQFVLFPTFVTDEEENTLTVGVNEHFAFVLNDIQQNFTRFELEEFISLDSKYAKTLYRLIKQYRTTGEYRVAVGEFRDLMGCPPSYTNYIFLRDIVQPSVKRLQQFFPLLKCTVLYAHKKGAPVTGYFFTFRGEDVNQLTIDQGVDEIRRIAEKKEKDKQKTKTRFNDFGQRTYDYGDLERQLIQAQFVEREKKQENGKRYSKTGRTDDDI